MLPRNAVTGNDYRGINILSLWVTALERGYEAGLFATSIRKHGSKDIDSLAASIAAIGMIRPLLVRKNC